MKTKYGIFAAVCLLTSAAFADDELIHGDQDDRGRVS